MRFRKMFANGFLQVLHVFREYWFDCLYKVGKGAGVKMGNPPTFSGYTANQYGWVQPAFVEYKISSWLGAQTSYTLGVIQHHWTVEWTIPP